MTKPYFKLSGRSGCKIELLDSGEKAIVRKYANTFSYNTRLMTQAFKQAQFKNLNKLTEFDCPAVLNRHEGNGQTLAWFEMEYIHAEKYSDYLERISVDELRSFVRVITRYFETAVSVSKLEKPNLSVFTNKKDELITKIKNISCLDQVFISELERFLSNPPGREVYTGPCHGDFTLSNILFGDHKIVLVDFLDSFYESPLQDIVKFRQDTCFGWTLMIDHDLPQHRYNKLVQIFEFVDRMISDHISNDNVLNTWYSYFQAFNLVRILPYLKAEHELMFVQSKLRELFK